MKSVGWAIAALVLAGLTARADTVVLVDGRVLEGTARREGDAVVVQQRYGETRVPQVQVRTITTGGRREAAKAPKAPKAGKAPEAETEEVGELLPPALPPGLRLSWEPDAAAAARRASESSKLVLTFLVVGELGTGRC